MASTGDTCNAVIYVGTVVSNGGDAAIMKAQRREIEAGLPEVRSVLVDQNPQVARRLFPDASVLAPVMQWKARSPRLKPLTDAVRAAYRARLLRIARKVGRGKNKPLRYLTSRERAMLKAIRDCRLVAYTGGTSLIEQYGIPQKLIEVEIAQAMGRPTVFLPQSMGPFTDPLSRRRMKAAIDNASLVLVRDERSLGHLVAIDADSSRVHVVPDVVFTSADDGADDRLRSAAIPEGARVAISVRPLGVFGDAGEQRRYEDSVQALVEHVVSQGAAKVSFVSTCQGLAGYWADDSAVALTIYGRLSPGAQERVEVMRESMSAALLKELFAMYDVAVCTRMHAAIIALNAGTPVLPIAYEFKIHEVLGQQLGLADYITDAQTVSGHQLVDAWERFRTDLPSFRDDLSKRMADIVDDARRVGPMVRDAVSS